MNSTVQVKLSGVCSEDKHPEGETAGCRDAVLQQLHRVIIWIGTPENSNYDKLFHLKDIQYKSYLSIITHLHTMFKKIQSCALVRK